MGEKTQALEKRAAELQEWVELGQTEPIRKLRVRVESEIIGPAIEAFHRADIDTKSNDVILRNTLTQRAVVRTARKIFDFFDTAQEQLDHVNAELKRIEGAAKKKIKAGQKGQQP